METYVDLNPDTIVRCNTDFIVKLIQPLELKMDALTLGTARLEDRVKSLEKKITNNNTLNIDLKK